MKKAEKIFNYVNRKFFKKELPEIKIKRKGYFYNNGFKYGYFYYPKKKKPYITIAKDLNKREIINTTVHETIHYFLWLKYKYDKEVDHLIGHTKEFYKIFKPIRRKLYAIEARIF